MKVVVCTRIWTPDVLRLTDVRCPCPRTTRCLSGCTRYPATPPTEGHSGANRRSPGGRRPQDHELGGGLAGDPGAVAGPGSCRLRNGITREATRSGSSSITRWPWPSSSSTWADGNARHWRSACSRGTCVLGPPDDQRGTVQRPPRGRRGGERGRRGRPVERQHGALGGPGPGRVVDAIELIARQSRVLAPKQQPEPRPAVTMKTSPRTGVRQIRA